VTDTEATDMRDLRLVGVSEDRHHVVLADDATGEEFRVAADESLRAALRGDRARLGQLETQMDSALRPRDIQARIRAGASPEEVADAAQLPLERVMGYAVPVLAEREHIVDRARTASVRRKHTAGPTRALGDTVTAQLVAIGASPETAAWDSWRRDDGRWVVTVAPGRDEATAHYVFDPAGRYVVADDDAARRLIADEPPTEDPSTMAVAAAVQDPRPSVVADPSPDHGVPLDPPDWMPQDGPVVGSDRIASDRTGSADRTADSTGSADDAVAVTDEAAEEPPPSGVTRLRRRRMLHQVPEPVPLPLPLEDDTASEAGADPDAAQRPAPRPEPRRRRDRRRTSVPSWDEIMFGGKGGE
jgi:hypothetical protein